MWSMNKILLPTDFSEIATAALDVAVELARRFSVPIVLMHAYDIPVYSYPATPYVPTAEMTASLEEASAQGLSQLRRSYESSGVDFSTMTRTGIAWEQILLAAKEVDAGLIIMGTHGRRGLPRAILGSVAEKVVRLSPIPVLTIHDVVPGTEAGSAPHVPDPKAADELVEHWQL
jgi:nucleotide-binding universal stress UspA family protein